ncbi:cuticle protein 64-like [Trichoplusia ni]|uniref:Cuticle protein 64-like n=1 Tax=Trichoplusia ni TaxID=7111 RepID=A0A7E5VZN8_TRINI|nr:cuticle protein 64-like [Trichoplusia ni]
MCLFGAVRASGWHGAGLGYSSGLGYASGLGYSGYVAPAYASPIVAKTVVAAPIVTKAVIPAVAYAPALSSVSRYQVHSSPIVKSYVAPVSYAAYSSPYPVAYGHGYSGFGSYGYGGYGHGAKYLW